MKDLAHHSAQAVKKNYKQAQRAAIKEMKRATCKEEVLEEVSEQSSQDEGWGISEPNTSRTQGRIIKRRGRFFKNS